MKIVKYLAICVISCLSTFILSADEPIKLLGKTTYYQENELQYRIRIVEILGKNINFKKLFKFLKKYFLIAVCHFAVFYIQKRQFLSFSQLHSPL